MTLLKNYTLDELFVGQTATFSKTLTRADIVLFASCSGDANPVHLDEAYAATTAFGGPIGHGMWTGALVSAAIATRLPGPGSVYRSQSLTFKTPVKPGDEVTVHLTITGIREKVRVVEIACEALNQDGKVIARGVAEVIAPAEKLEIPAAVLPVVRIEE